MLYAIPVNEQKCIQDRKKFILTFMNPYFWKSEFILIHFNLFLNC